MKYVPIWVPVILILGLIAVRLYRPLPVGDGAGASGAATICEGHRTVGSMEDRLWGSIRPDCTEAASLRR
jgi:hypothetical protein